MWSVRTTVRVERWKGVVAGLASLASYEGRKEERREGDGGASWLLGRREERGKEGLKI